MRDPYPEVSVGYNNPRQAGHLLSRKSAIGRTELKLPELGLTSKSSQK